MPLGCQTWHSRIACRYCGPKIIWKLKIAPFLLKRRNCCSLGSHWMTAVEKYNWKYIEGHFFAKEKRTEI